MKKIKILGKSVPVFLLAIIGVVGIGSASLVGYLSINTVRIDTTVSSPIEIWTSKTNGGYQQGDLSYNIYGGETVTVWVKTQNYANADISGDIEVLITGGNCNDFSDMKYNDVTSVISYCIDLDSVNAKVLVPTSWTATQIAKDKIDITFKGDALGLYGFDARVTA